MNLTFHCPNCGAPLDPPSGSNLSMRCPFCSSSVIIPIELRRHPSESETLTRKEAMRQLPDSGHNLMEIIQMVKSGKRQEAINRFRENFDTSRNTAESAIARIEQGEVVELSHLLKSPGETNSSPVQDNHPPRVIPQKNFVYFHSEWLVCRLVSSVSFL